MFHNLDSVEGVSNGKCETLRDRETSVFLCEPETYDFLDCETETSKHFECERETFRLFSSPRFG